MMQPNLDKKAKAAPFGLVTLMMVALLLGWQWLGDQQDACDDLANQLTGKIGYFLNWSPPALTLVLADKSQFQVEAENRSAGCRAMTNEIRHHGQ